MQCGGPETAIGIYVSADGNDSGVGTKSDPVLSIQTAITLAKQSSYTNIYVQYGIYTPGKGLESESGSYGLNIYQFNNLNLSGGWNADFSSQTGKSVLDGQNVSKSYRIIRVDLSDNVKISGFSIQNGSMTNYSGGGILLYQSTSCKIENTEVRNCSAKWGGGISVYEGSGNSVNANVQNNSAINAGGGVYVIACANSSVSGTVASNSALNGGGVCGYGLTNATVNASVSANAADDSQGVGGGVALYYANGSTLSGAISANGSRWGGGAYVYSGSGNTISSTISGNTAAGWGGGLSIDGTANNTISGAMNNNQAMSGGGGICATGVSENTISSTISANNVQSATGQGGGLFIQDSSGARLDGAILANNTARNGGAVNIEDSENVSLLDTVINYAENIQDTVDSIIELKDDIEGAFEAGKDIKNFLISNTTIFGGGASTVIEETTGSKTIEGIKIENVLIKTNGSETIFKDKDGVEQDVSTMGNGNTVTDNPNKPTVPVTDKTPPTISITSPANNAQLTGTITISGTASDSGTGVKRVSLKVEGPQGWPSYIQLSGTTSWTTNVEFTKIGTYTILVMALDNNDNPSQIYMVTNVTYGSDTTGPTLSISSPQNNANIIPASGSSVNVRFQGVAEDDGIGIKAIQISMDSGSWTSLMVCPGPNAPARAELDKTLQIGAGTHVIKLRALDYLDNPSTETTLNITVGLDAQVNLTGLEAWGTPNLSSGYTYLHNGYGTLSFYDSAGHTFAITSDKLKNAGVTTVTISASEYGYCIYQGGSISPSWYMLTAQADSYSVTFTKFDTVNKLVSGSITATVHPYGTPGSPKAISGTFKNITIK